MTEAVASGEAFEERLRLVEDRLAIADLIASYGPAADAGQGERTAGIWAQHGDYVVPGFGIAPGRTGVMELIEGETHQSLIDHGCAHLLSPHVVDVRGDEAVATGYALVVIPEDGGGFRVWRSVATRWELRRGEDGWECERRVNSLLDGRPESRHLLARAAD